MSKFEGKARTLYFESRENATFIFSLACFNFITSSEHKMKLNFVTWAPLISVVYIPVPDLVFYLDSVYSYAWQLIILEVLHFTDNIWNISLLMISVFHLWFSLLIYSKGHRNAFELLPVLWFSFYQYHGLTTVPEICFCSDILYHNFSLWLSFYFQIPVLR